MNDETYKLPTNEEIRDMEMGIPVIAKPTNTVEDRITTLEATISKQTELINLCLEAIERFGSNHQTSYNSFIQEFDRIKSGS
tara:strand:+ start:943 stop:1188 length:246 start_codon:yes stop_codon:yes gene_type:complete